MDCREAGNGAKNRRFDERKAASLRILGTNASLRFLRKRRLIQAIGIEGRAECARPRELYINQTP